MRNSHKTLGCTSASIVEKVVDVVVALDVEQKAGGEREG